MESKPSKTDVRRVIGALKRSKKKVVTLESLSRLTGLYPDVLGERVSHFIPMILLDPSINIRDYLPEMEAYCEAKSKQQPKRPSKRVLVRKAELASYRSLVDFIYRKMTSVGGLLDPSYALTDEDLAIMKKLLEAEIRLRRDPKARKKGQRG